MQGIPFVYYGTEQDLDGTHPQRSPKYQGVREALWGKPSAFDQTGGTFLALQQLASLRSTEAVLRYGRLYFRQVSGDGVNFGASKGSGGILAFSRVLAGREVLIVANTQGDPTTVPWRGFSVVDVDLNRTVQTYSVAYSNLGTAGTGTVGLIPNAVFWDDNNSPSAPAEAAALISSSGLVRFRFCCRSSSHLSMSVQTIRRENGHLGQVEERGQWTEQVIAAICRERILGLILPALLVSKVARGGTLPSLSRCATKLSEDA